jgi:ubiquinol-cytochrome c reductase iron-sulfur subunit|tara:strand:- start:2504 stop:3082 length:579 start_codon:yes stop_codon:yes gene_type:complete
MSETKLNTPKINVETYHDEATANRSVEDASKRDFLVKATAATSAVGAAAAAYPFISTLQPASNVKALASIEVDLSDIAEGEGKVVLWRGKPVFLRHRTAEEIERVKQDDDLTDLKDPQKDSDRVKNEKWLIVIAVCTHLGCVPNDGGNFDGWLCPCHGSQFDLSGRVRKGPAATNLEVPPYEFINETTVKIG